jgi:Uma2 family endonuclease
MIQGPSINEDFVVLTGVPWQTYVGVTDALGEHHLRHTYDRGLFELRRQLYGVSWQDYERFLSGLGDFHVRHIYDRGMLEFMSPLKSHDWIKRLISRFIETWAYDQKLPIQSIGSTTITNPRTERGFEADEAYYIASEPKVRGKDTYDPSVDPPPDLIIEVDVTSSSKKQLELYGQMKVPEVWLHDGQSLKFLRRSPRGKYREAEHSLAFPFLTPADIERLLIRRHEFDETELARKFVSWARKRLKAHRRKR